MIEGLLLDTMPAMQASFRVRTRKKAEVVDLTPQVADLVSRSAVDEGVCTVFVRHATAAVVINENADPGFRLDLVAPAARRGSRVPARDCDVELRVRARPA